MEGKSDNNAPVFSWDPVFDLSRTGFALWVWSGMVRCHDGLVLCLLGAALTALQADTCVVVYKIFKRFKWSLGASFVLWFVLLAITWWVVYQNSKS